LACLLLLKILEGHMAAATKFNIFIQNEFIFYHFEFIYCISA